MQEFDPRRLGWRLTPRLAVAVVGLAALGIGWRLTSTSANTPLKTPLDPAAYEALQAQASQMAAAPGYAPAESVPLKIERGETFEAAVQRAGVPADEARQVVETLAGAFDTVHIKAGLAFEAAIAKPRDRRGPARLVGLSLRSGPASAITVSRTFDGALRLRELDEKVTDQTAVIAGAMQDSLFESAERAGASQTVTAKVADLFAHKLDFTRDIQPGDQFKMVYDRKVTDSGRTVETGDLLYAEIAAKGGINRFYRFDHDGSTDYFDELGKNIKGLLLRTPVDGARITSTFGMREHPILGYTRAHQGVDFGAGTGTPILAAGDGVVVEAKRWGGYGNWLRIRHSGEWETGYGHISRYAPGIKAGVRVHQGEVVAYVGATGLATGPHLHYEVWEHGQRVNPIGAKVPQGVTLAGAELAAFNTEKARIDHMIEAGPALASADSGRPQVALRGGIGLGQSGALQR